MATVFNANFAVRLAIRAKEMGVSQADVARATGSSKSTVNAWFSGAAVPRLENLVPICTVLSCSIYWLVTGKSDKADQLHQTNVAGAMLPALLPTGERNYDNKACFPLEILAKHDSIDSLAWLKVPSHSGLPAIEKGDLVIVDTNFKQSLEDGSYFVFFLENLNQIACYRVTWEVDGVYLTLSENDGSVKVKLSTVKEIKPLGEVLYRFGPC